MMVQVELRKIIMREGFAIEDSWGPCGGIMTCGAIWFKKTFVEGGFFVTTVAGYRDRLDFTPIMTHNTGQ